MSALLIQYQNQFLIFLLVFTRLGGLMTTAPVFGAQAVPIRIRGLLTVALALVTAPVFMQTSFEVPRNLLQLGALVIAEASLGAILGIGIMILFSGIQLVGQLSSQMSGMHLANAADPNFDEQTPLFGQLLNMITLMAFLCLGGHRLLIEALLETFAWMPPGHASLPAAATEALTEMMVQSFRLGMQAGAPLMVSLLVANVLMGLLSRTLPQLSIMAVGFSVNAMVLLCVMMLSIASTVYIFQGHLQPAFDVMRELVIPH